MLRIRSLPFRSMVPVCHSPPYVPIDASGLTTNGVGGRRCSTGGSLPPFTRSASIGASLNFVGGLDTTGAAAVGCDTAVGGLATGADVATGGAGAGGAGGSDVPQALRRAAALVSVPRRSTV